jgi:hypothetical protein
MLGNYRVALHLVASRLVLSSIELVSQLVRNQGYCNEIRALSYIVEGVAVGYQVQVYMKQ